MRIITAESFLSRYASGERDFYGTKLVNADLSGANWQDANPVGQTINGAVLGDGDFSGTDFRANNMGGSNFSGSKLVGCQFDRANLTGTCFINSNLTNSSFRGANLTRIELTGANLTNACFVEADLTGADLTYAEIAGADFTSAILTDVKMPSSPNDVVWTENDDIKNWVIQTINYYRKLDFFNDYSDLSDEELANVLKYLCQKEEWLTGGRFDGRGDWELIWYDKQRVLNVSIDAIYGDDPGGYDFNYSVQVLELWSNISRGSFYFANVSNIADSVIGLTIDDVFYTLDPWQDPYKLAPQINQIISPTGYQFEIWDLSPDVFVIVLSQEEKKKLQADRSWSFANLKM